MQSLQARLILAAFLAVATAIGYNMVFRQSMPHSVNQAADAEPGRPVSIVRQPVRDAEAPRQEYAAVGADTIKAIQRELAARGYETGPIDGELRAISRAAIIAYQYDKELAVTGTPSMRLLQHIVLGESTDDPPEPTDKEVPEATVALIKAVQQTLAELGYGPGPVDGIMGGGTTGAIESFERAQGLPVTGRVSGELLRELARITGRRPGHPAS